MSTKIIRDPLYNYISIDQNKDRWLIELLDTCQRTRIVTRLVNPNCYEV